MAGSKRHLSRWRARSTRSSPAAAIDAGPGIFRRGDALMTDGPNKFLVTSDLSERLQRIRARTPARILMGRAGAAYRTNVQIELREAHAAARDAVREEMDLLSVFGEAFVRKWELFEVQTRATGKDEYLLRPDLGRHFDESSRLKIQARCSRSSDLQIVI